MRRSLNSDQNGHVCKLSCAFISLGDSSLEPFLGFLPLQRIDQRDFRRRHAPLVKVYRHEDHARFFTACPDEERAWFPPIGKREPDPRRRLRVLPVLGLHCRDLRHCADGTTGLV